jgi:transposase
MDQWVKRTQRDYTLSFKLAVVDQVERGEITISQAQERYGIQGSSTVQTWLRKHGRLGRKAASSAAKGRNMSEPKPKPLTPEQRIKELEVQLKQAQEKAAFFEAMVTVIKRDHGIEVTKKPLGKFSKKSSSKD